MAVQGKFALLSFMTLSAYKLRSCDTFRSFSNPFKLCVVMQKKKKRRKNTKGDETFCKPLYVPQFYTLLSSTALLTAVMLHCGPVARSF